MFKDEIVLVVLNQFKIPRPTIEYTRNWSCITTY